MKSRSFSPTQHIFQLYFIYENGGDWTRTNEDRSRGIYSPLQLPLCDTPLKGMLEKGIEPSTIRLQVGRSTN